MLYIIYLIILKYTYLVLGPLVTEPAQLGVLLTRFSSALLSGNWADTNAHRNRHNRRHLKCETNFKLIQKKIKNIFKKNYKSFQIILNKRVLLLPWSNRKLLANANSTEEAPATSLMFCHCICMLH